MKRAFTVYYGDESGELISIDFSESFRRSTPLLKSDVLLDAIHELMETYNKSLKEDFHAKGQRSESEGERGSEAFSSGTPGGQARP